MIERRNRIMQAVGRLDWPLLIVVGLLSTLGLINLRSASMHSASAFHLYQAMWLAGGLVMALGVAFVNTRVFVRGAHWFYAGVILLLVAVMVVGTELNASQRWLNLGVFMMQPSELLKVGVILVTARFFHVHDKEGSYQLHQLWRIFALVGFGVLFVLQQPDLGTSLVIVAIFMTMVLFEGVRWESLVVLALAVLVALPLAYSFVLQDYQQDRVRAFMNIEADAQGQSWQVQQSLVAFGSGRMWGKGHVEGTQIQKGFVPEHENDFIAANWAEERGFVGMVFLLMVYLAFVICALNISRRARNRFGVLVAVGVAAMFFWHVVINLGMVTGVLPVVGLTLPLVSYGGSSLLAMLIGVGLLLNISVHRRPFH